MDSELLELMPHEITIEPPDGTYTDAGRPNYGAAVTYTCYIEPVNGEVIMRGADGQERKASWRIYVGSTSTLNPEGRLTLPAGYTPQQPPQWAIGLTADEAGANHSVILV